MSAQKMTRSQWRRAQFRTRLGFMAHDPATWSLLLSMVICCIGAAGLVPWWGIVAAVAATLGSIPVSDSWKRTASGRHHWAVRQAALERLDKARERGFTGEPR